MRCMITVVRVRGGCPVWNVSQGSVINQAPSGHTIDICLMFFVHCHEMNVGWFVGIAVSIL